MRDILRLARNGQTVFEPASEAPLDIARFQEVVRTLVEAKALGYLESVLPHVDSDTAGGYDSVIVGPLTDAGDRYASGHED
jgi:adenosylcobinamide amidohydrolase